MADSVSTPPEPLTSNRVEFVVDMPRQDLHSDPDAVTDSRYRSRMGTGILRWVKLLRLTLLAALFMSGCAGGDGTATGGGSIERTDWRLSQPPDGRSLELFVFSGHSSCLTYDHVETDESENSVEIRAYVRSNGDESCTDDFVTERVQVRLEQDLDNRKLEGCGGPEVDWEGFEEPSNDCRDVYEF